MKQKLLVQFKEFHTLHMPVKKFDEHILEEVRRIEDVEIVGDIITDEVIVEVESPSTAILSPHHIGMAYAYSEDNRDARLRKIFSELTGIYRNYLDDEKLLDSAVQKRCERLISEKHKTPLFSKIRNLFSHKETDDNDTDNIDVPNVFEEEKKKFTDELHKEIDTALESIVKICEKQIIGWSVMETYN